MSTNKKDLLAKIKSMFLGEVPPVAAPIVAPVVAAVPTPCAYPVDGGVNVVVDISDDGLPGIDQGDPVFSDTAMTVPYPDGTYNITGTQFGFTVAGGVVSAINDPSAMGPGAPVAPAVAPVTAAVPVAPTFEERLAALESKVNVVPAGMATEIQLQEATEKFSAQEEKITKNEVVIAGLFDLIEQLLKEPTAEPKTLTDAEKAKFKKIEDKDSRFARYADHMKKNKTLN